MTTKTASKRRTRNGSAAMPTLDARDIVDMGVRNLVAEALCKVARPQGYNCGMWPSGYLEILPDFPSGKQTEGMLITLIDGCPSIEIQIGQNDDQDQPHVWLGHRGGGNVPIVCFPLAQHPATGEALFDAWKRAAARNGKRIPARGLGNWLNDVATLWVEAVKEGLANRVPKIETMHETSNYDE